MQQLRGIADSKMSPNDEKQLSEQIEVTVRKASSALTEEHKDRLRAVLTKHHKAFVAGKDTLGLCPHAEHSIELRDNIPVVSRPYRCSPADRDFLREQVNILKQKGVIRESDSAYASPTLVINQPHHPSTPKRMVHDYRQLNRKTVNTPYPMPIIEDVLDEVTRGGAKIFNVMDIKTAFLSIRVKPEDVHKTAFVTPDGKYEYLRMAFGFCKAPQTMLAVMRRTFSGMKRTATYMDDIGQGASEIDEAIDLLEEALRRVVINGLKMDIAKCQIERTEVNFLGYIISAKGRKPDPKRVADVEKFQPQKDAKHLFSFLQFANYFRKFIKDFASTTHPLRKLLHKDALFNWTDEQVQDDIERVIEYASKSLNSHDSKQHSNVLECMAVHWAVTEKFSVYLRGGQPFKVLTDNYSVVYAASIGKLNRNYGNTTYMGIGVSKTNSAKHVHGGNLLIWENVDLPEKLA